MWHAVTSASVHGRTHEDEKTEDIIKRHLLLFSILQMQPKAPKARLKALLLISNHHQRLPL
jgi:hypothetical protein